MHGHRFIQEEAFMKKKILAVTAAVCMAAMLAGCGSETAETKAAEVKTEAAAEAKTEAAEAKTEETSAAGGKLVMATNAEFPPYEYYDDGGSIVGIDIDIATAIAEYMGMECEVEDMAFDSIIPSIQSGKADFGLAGITVSEDRKASVDFTDTYATATQVVIVKDGSDIKTPDDLTGKTIGVQLGTTGDIYASDIEGATVEQYNKGFEAVQALSQGKIDAVVIDGEPAKVFVSQDDSLKVLDDAMTVEEYAICVKKGNDELVNKINEAIAALKESGKLQEIVDKYITAE